MRIALLGEFTPSFAPHVATMTAVQHAAAALGADVAAQWVSTSAVDDRLLSEHAGLWVAPGSPYKSMDGALQAIREARERGIPCLGTCGGFQHMVLEYARHVLSFADAQHAEYPVSRNASAAFLDPSASRLFISALECSLLGRAMTLQFTPGSRVAEIYGSLSAEEEYYCNFGVSPEAVPLLRNGSLAITGSDAEGEVRVIEIADHPFFIGTLFVPQMRSTAERPHPLVAAFIRAVVAAER